MKDKASKARAMAVDFAGSVLLALTIGVGTSFALGSAVLLIVHQSTTAETSAAQSGEERG